MARGKHLHALPDTGALIESHCLQDKECARESTHFSTRKFFIFTRMATITVHPMARMGMDAMMTHLPTKVQFRVHCSES
jgi:hypothetical protein